MNLSLNWVQDFTDVTGIAPKDYCDRMTDTGSKVEGFRLLGDDIENVVVGRITKITKHENSDHLQICMINVGKGEDVQIVTGAQNVFEGAIVPAALAPARLPGDVVIKAGKLRGVESNGMLCSMGELNLTSHDMPGKEEDGILILDECFADKIGTDIKEALMLSDTVVEFEITSNRPDCLSVIGLARETAASFERSFNIPTPTVKGSGDGDTIGNYLSVRIDSPELCHRYTARVVKNVKIEPSPLWMRMRLRAAGVRPINNIVDITNYVMLEYGQPMHAFDYSCLDGSEIIVRNANDGETFVSLDSQKHTLDSSMLVIADKNKAVALAGVMGGENSEITESTKTVVFESACFLGSSVRVTAKKNGMRTESSARFEKGLDSENTFGGLQRACELVELLGAGEVVNEIIDVYPKKTAPAVLKLEPEKINAFLGVDLSADYMKDVLRKLEFTIDGDNVIAPSFRSDIGCMNDIAEEIIRIYGYNKIESSAIKAELTQGKRTPKQLFAASIADSLCMFGLNEIHTFSFISPKYYDKIRLDADDKLRNSIVISNPLGEDTSVMRTTAIPSMLEVLARNNNFSNENVGLFENATVYIPREANDLPNENKVVTIGMYGNTDFYRFKGIIENLLRLASIKNVSYVACTNNNIFHPGHCAEILASDGVSLGIFGQIHPLTAANYGLENTVTYIAAIDFDALFDHINFEKHYTPIPKFPAVTRDFSFVCDEELEVGKIVSCINSSGGKLVENVNVFDIYRGEKLGEQKKSVSIRVTFRADHTLTVEEADKASKKVLSALEHVLGITLRA
ncbi:MAG: phenylalanine--tRNA ligase subunit beta [Clostridia bacterium]|nr:phenylalanine--tRNA ligase subunit beta [Clostridia bacterium]